MPRQQIPKPLVTPTHIQHIHALLRPSSGVLISANLLKQLSLPILKKLLRSCRTTVLQIEDQETLDFLKLHLKLAKNRQVIFLSTQLCLLGKIETAYPASRRVYKSTNSNWKPNKLIVHLNRYRIRTVMLAPTTAVSLCHPLRKHALSVWSHAEDQRHLHDLIVSGVQSISVPFKCQFRSLWNNYDQLRIVHRPVFIAHRGACQLKQENTLAAFEWASRYGADVLETDVRETKDGKLVLFHDATLKRLTGDRRSVAEVTLEQMKSLMPVVELETFLATYQHSSHTLLLELKEEQIVSNVVEFIQKYELWHQVHIQSFLPKVLEEVQAMQPQLGISLLYSHNKASKVHLSKSFVKRTLLNTQASFNPKIRRARRFRKQRKDGIQSFYWTIRTKKELEIQWSQGKLGLIMDCIQYTKSYPIQLTVASLPSRNKVGTLSFPSQQQAIFGDGSTEWVLVKWYIQTQSGLRQVTDEVKTDTTIHVFCVYRIVLSGVSKSICSALIRI
ncbi:glycerophosphodiester phosphodiesterase [Alkalihalobacillus sp. NPDC078783]